jgi:hypothetical protein
LQLGLASSKAEAKRLVKGNGAKLNGEKVTLALTLTWP